jgi:hypothetical protein
MQKYNLQNKSSKKETKILQDNPKSLKLLYSIMNINTISLPWQARPKSMLRERERERERET